MNPALQKRVQDQFEAAARRHAGAIPARLWKRRSLTHPAALQLAYEKTRALEILFKVDLCSALGVTLTFSSVDGGLTFQRKDCGRRVLKLPYRPVWPKVRSAAL